MLIDKINDQLIKNKNAKLLRHRYAIQTRDDNAIKINNQVLLNFASNDYLGIAEHDNIKNAFIKGVEKYGLGSSSSPLISGYYSPHQQLEQEVAEFLGRDKAILFNSGYHANLGVISTFANRQTTIIADKLCHASLLDGILLSRAKHYRYRHNDVAHCQELLNQQAAGCVLITESVFSMEGDITPVDKIANLAKQHAAFLIVDDAHGVGILGEQGRGITEHFQLTQHDVACLITPLGKAVGSMGAIVSGSEDLIEGLVQFARTYRYSTALPPALAMATLEAFKIIKNEKWRREKLLNLNKLFIQEAQNRGLSLISTALTPIQSILVGDNQLALELQNWLLQQGIYVSCIRPPTVPKNSARIRVSLNCLHEENDVVRLLDLIAAFYEQRQ